MSEFIFPRPVGIYLAGNVEIRVEREGLLQRIIRTRNLFVRSGRNLVRDLIGYPELPLAGGATPGFMGVGTSGATTTDSMGVLTAEVFRKAISRKIPLDSAITMKMFLDTTEANGNTLREIGLFSTSAAGLLWARATHTDIVKTSSVSVTYVWTITMTAS